MLFNADIRENFAVEEVNLKKTKTSERNFHQKVENMKRNFTLILD